MKIQKFIATLGFNLGKNDRIFRVITESALKNFQSQNGLKLDGIVLKNSESYVK